MAVHSLTSVEQKAALSGKNKKKKTVKNILGIPEGFRENSRVVDECEVRNLYEHLHRLLPCAKLPILDKTKSNSNSLDNTGGNTLLRETAKSKRNQLSLGVNSVNKNIQKNLISAVLLASDIQPKFLIDHLNLLCHHNNIPFLYVPNLREITAANLGFPCIAIGFKKDSCDFLEVIEEIKSIYDSKKLKNESKSQIIEVVCSELDETDANNHNAESPVETPIIYLFRTSVTERAFIPEIESKSLAQNKTKSDFITVENKNEEGCTAVVHRKQLGISSKMNKKQLIKAQRLNSFVKSRTEDDNDEELEVIKKKPKKDWVVDKVGSKQNCKYHSAKLHKIFSNTRRNSRKCKK